ncbi:reverse transcriptase domain-containing protein [Tanacetum coccineum]
MASEREITPPPGFLAVPTTTTMFVATTPENMPLAYHASTSTNPNLVISPAFVEANYETLESLLRDRRRQMRNNDLRTELEYFSEDYDEEREMEPRPKPARAVTPPLRAASPRVRRRRERVVGFEETQNRGESRVERNSEGGRPSEEASRGNGSQNVNLPPLLAAHIGRSENGQPLQSSLTSAYGGQALSNNVGGNLPPNAHGLPSANSDGKPPIGGSFANLPQGGHVPSTFTNGNILPQNGFMHPANIPLNSYPFYTQPMYAFPNMPAYANPNPTGLFPNPLGSVTPFVRWIEDYPIPDGLKMPSHIGSYDEKWDPDNFLHLFEGDIRMQKWLMPVACHMFTYTLKDFAMIWWNSQKEGEGKKDKSTAPVEAPILMINREDYAAKNTISGSMAYKEEIMFPPVTKVSNAPVIIEAAVFGRKVGRVYMDSGSTCEYDSLHNMLLGRTTMQKMGIMVSTIYGAIKFHTKRGVGTVLSAGEAGEETKKARRTLTISKERIPNCDDTEEKIVVNDKYPEQKITIGKQLPEHFKKELRNLLRANANIFAWTHADITGIPRTIMNKRSLGPDSNTTACKEAEELTKAGIFQKVKHQIWVANPVMVKKNDGGWRMCVDFRDINKVYPKDCYPLPKIDWKLESLAGLRLKCFLDAYKGYHQIQMAEGDEDKTTFFVREGVFCYGKIPFGLKNAGATYQRLVDKVFSKQIERNLEAYFNDMVIKSTLLSDIQETFERFRSINMKLNPKKCSFGVEEGPFLGHLITKPGIKANPLKIKAVAELEKPRELKDIQSLNGKLAALSRFLLKGAERSLPFFKVLKSCKGKKKIHWTEEADKVFKEMKKFVQDLPTLTAPRAGETLTMYPVESKESINAELFAKRSEGQIPIYFALKILSSLHDNGSHRDERETPTNFLPEIPFNDNEKKVKEKEVSDPSNECKLYTDGASSFDGAGARLMLIDPASKEYTYALRFEFETTNNEAEYEALLAGFQDTKEARKIRIQVPQYNLIRGILYKRSFFTPWLRCIAPPQTDKIINEIHEGSCGFNAEPRSMVVRITKQGYYWPSMHSEAEKAIQDFDKCKEQSTIRKARVDGAIAVESTWPFSH